MSTEYNATLQLEALQSLLQHPGWGIVHDQMRKMADVELAAMRKSDSAEATLRHTYRYVALLEALQVPDTLFKPLLMQVQTNKQK